MKLSDVVRIEGVFENLIVRNKALPLSVGFEFYPLCEILAKFRETRDEAIRKYGEAQEGGQVGIKFDSPKFPEYQAEIEKLVSVKIKFEPVTITTTDAQAGGLTLGDIRDLRDILTVVKG